MASFFTLSVPNSYLNYYWATKTPHQIVFNQTPTIYYNSKSIILSKPNNKVPHSNPSATMRLLILFLLSLLFLSIKSLMNFERIIWLYWQTDITQAPLVTRISYEKLVIAAQKANWTVNLVTGQNAKNFIPDYETFEDVVKRGYRNTVQQKSDILRITLVEANGGVWIDFACILFEDLSWLSDQTKFQSLIINRIGTNKEDPDMLMLGQGYHQSPLSYYNQDGVLVNDQYFGMAIHFIAAKKKSPIMTAWKQKMYAVTTLSYQQFLPQIHANRLYFHNIDRDTMYYSGNMALQSVLQQKQMQFDDNLTLNSKRVKLYQHYKIWMVHGEVGPILMTRKHLMNGRDLFMDTMEEIEQRAGKVRFYLKMAKFLREQVQEKMKPTEEYFTKNNITVQQILKRGPTFHQCSLFFIVQNSILGNFYHKSKYSHEIKTPIITVAQRQQLKSHCWYKSPSIYLSSHQYRSQGQMTRPERQLLNGKVDGFFGWLAYAWTTNSLVFWAWFEWFRTLGYLVVIYWVGKYLLFRYKMDANGEMARLSKPEIWELVWIVLLIVVTSASLQFYEEFQNMGKFPQYECTLIAILTVFLLRGLLKKITQSTIEKPTFFHLQRCMKNTRYLIFLPLAFCVFLHFDIVYSFAFYHAIVIGGGGLLFYALLEELSQRKLSNRYFDVVRKGLKLSRWFVIAIFLALYFVPNLRYLRHDHRYIKQNISEIALTVFWFTLIPTIVFILVSHYKKIKSSTSEAERNEMLHMMFITASVFIITLQSHLAYEAIISSPSSHNVMGNFQVILIVYTLQNISIRQRLPVTWSSESTQLFIMSNILPAFYMVFGMRFLKFFDIVPLRWLWFMIIPVYVMLVILEDQWTNKSEFNKIESVSSETFHGVELSPKN